MHIRDHDKRIYRQLGLERGCQQKSNRTDPTYVEDVKYIGEVPPPSCNRFLIVLRTEESGGRVSFPLLGDIFLNPSHSSTVGSARGSPNLGVA